MNPFVQFTHNRKRRRELLLPLTSDFHVQTRSRASIFGVARERLFAAVFVIALLIVPSPLRGDLNKEQTLY